jgi:hypothetical protein
VLRQISLTMTCSAAAQGIEISAATNPPNTPPAQSPSDVPSSTDISTSSGLTFTVLLMMSGFRTWFSSCWYATNTAAVTRPAVSEWARANSTVGMPASAPPIMGRKSTIATHSPHSSGNGSPRAAMSAKMTTPAISDVARLPTT